MAFRKSTLFGAVAAICVLTLAADAQAFWGSRGGWGSGGSYGGSYGGSFGGSYSGSHGGGWGSRGGWGSGGSWGGRGWGSCGSHGGRFARRAWRHGSNGSSGSFGSHGGGYASSGSHGGGYVSYEGDDYVRSERPTISADTYVQSQSQPKTSLTLHVPAKAKVTLAGVSTKQTGDVRTYSTNRLADGQNWDDYTIVVELERDGQKLREERTITLIGGESQDLEISFENKQIAKL